MIEAIADRMGRYVLDNPYRILAVRRWPAVPRRAFVLLSPVSFPLWLLAVPTIVALQIVVLLTAWLLLTIHGLWVGEPEKLPSRPFDDEED